MMRVKWETVIGVKYEGELIEIECNTAYVKLDDGTQKAVEVRALEEVM
jgi:hypothetical protein